MVKFYLQSLICNSICSIPLNIAQIRRLTFSFVSFTYEIVNKAVICKCSFYSYSAQFQESAIIIKRRNCSWCKRHGIK